MLCPWIYMRYHPWFHPMFMSWMVMIDTQFDSNFVHGWLGSTSNFPPLVIRITTYVSGNVDDLMLFGVACMFKIRKIIQNHRPACIALESAKGLNRSWYVACEGQVKKTYPHKHIDIIVQNIDLLVVCEAPRALAWWLGLMPPMRRLWVLFLMPAWCSPP